MTTDHKQFSYGEESGSEVKEFGPDGAIPLLTRTGELRAAQRLVSRLLIDGISFNETAARARFGGQYYSAANANGSFTATAVIDWSKSNVHTGAVTQNTTFQFQFVKPGGRYVLRLLQDESGSRTYTWPSNVAWPGGTAPAPSAGGRIDVITFVCDGASCYGGSSLNY